MRRRLVLAIAGVAAVAVLLLAIPLAVVLGRAYRDEELLRLQRDTIAATRPLDLGANRRDPIELPPSSDVVGVYDRSGRRLAGTGPAIAPEVVRRAMRSGRPADAVGGGRLVVAVPLVSGERVAGAVRAERSDASAVERAHDTWVILGAVALGIIAAAVLAAVALGRRLAAPLERLAATARRLGDGDFSVRAPRAGIPEVDAVGNALDATSGRLDDLVTRERAFSADASHQLRTPVQALRLELEAAQLRGETAPEIPAALAQVDRLQATIDTLLAVARDAPRSGASTDLAGVLRELESRWRGPLAAEGRPLRVDIGAAHPTALASAGVVSEILEVLLGNARAHGAGAVSVVVRDIESFVSIDVADEGRGFAADPEQAFTRRSGDGNGHGIGLALARSLAHAEGGRLTVVRPGPSPVLSLVLPAPPRSLIPLS